VSAAHVEIAPITTSSVTSTCLSAGGVKASAGKLIAKSTGLRASKSFGKSNGKLFDKLFDKLIGKLPRTSKAGRHTERAREGATPRGAGPGRRAAGSVRRSGGSRPPEPDHPGPRSARTAWARTTRTGRHLRAPTHAPVGLTTRPRRGPPARRSTSRHASPQPRDLPVAVDTSEQRITVHQRLLHQLDPEARHGPGVGWRHVVPSTVQLAYQSSQSGPAIRAKSARSSSSSRCRTRRWPGRCRRGHREGARAGALS
jgi:hypothetical protein